MSIYLLTILIALLLSQGSKVIAALINGHKDEWILALTRSGGMPSAHSSVIVAIIIVIGAREGIDSAVFGLAIATGLIVMYDALNVRRSVGEQGAVIKQLITEMKLAAEGYPYKQATGHHPGEVLIGAATGVITAAIALYFI